MAGETAMAAGAAGGGGTTPALAIGFACTFTLLGTTLTIACADVEAFDAGTLAIDIPSGATFNFNDFLDGLGTAKIAVPPWLTASLANVSFSVLGWFRRPDTTKGETVLNFQLAITITDTNTDPSKKGSLLDVLIPDQTAETVIDSVLAVNSVTLNLNRGTQQPPT